jgi:hypothetical protein
VAALAKFAFILGADALRFVILSLRPSRSIAAETLFLRRQLALYKERGAKQSSWCLGRQLTVVVRSVLGGLHHEYALVAATG